MKKLLFFLLLIGASPVLAMQDDDRGQRAEDLIDRFGQEAVRRVSHEEFVARLADAVSEAERQMILEEHRASLSNGHSILNSYLILSIVNKCLQPKNIGLLSLGALGLFGAWHGSGLLRDVIRHKLLIPPLATKTNIKTWYSFKKRPDKLTLDQVILPDALTQEAEFLLHSAKYGAANDLPLRHWLFYGAPGTGKTMLSQAIADQAGLKYLYFPASKLLQYSEKEGERQIARLFEYAAAYPEKLMIIMDEVDGIMQNRDTCPPKMLSFLTSILSYMGTESTDYMVVGISNRPQDLDEASKSRFGVQLEIGPPGFEERLRLLRHYASIYFSSSLTKIKDKRPWYKKLLGSKVRFREPLKLDDDVTHQVVEDLARKTEGFVGRDISDMLLAVQSAGYYSQHKTVTKEMLYHAVATKKHQLAAEKNFEKGRKKRP